MVIQAILRAEADPTKSEYLLAPDVILLLVQDGSARLLDLGGNFYAISQTGATMLHETLKAGITSAAVRIATEYDAELSHVQNDLHAFLYDLEEKQLIHHSQQTRHAFKRKAILPSLLLMPLLYCIYNWTAPMKRRTWALLTLAHISIRMFGWPSTIIVWQRYLHKIAPSTAILELEQAARDVDEVVRTVAARHLLRIECKERGLSCWALFRSIGFPAKLVIGVDLFPLACHCWCEAGQFILSDDQDRCEQFTPVLSYE